MIAPIVTRIQAYLAGQLPLAELLDGILDHPWWVAHDGDEAYAYYDSEEVGFLAVYSGPGMAADFDWQQWDAARLLQELRDDPDLGVVFDYSYEWATNFRPNQVRVLVDALAARSA